MKKRIADILVLSLSTICLLLHSKTTIPQTKDPEIIEVTIDESVDIPVVETPIIEIVDIPEIIQEQPDDNDILEEIIEEELLMSKEDIELIALVTMAEAEGESELGKRLVIDTILNRVDHHKFPDTVHGVIYQKHQFTSMTNGRVNKCYVRDDICKLVEEELKSRTNNDTIFFTAGKYGSYGKPLLKEGNHYFSSY